LNAKTRQLEINLGKACNNACVFCANGAVPAAERKFVAPEIIAEELERGANSGYTAVGFLGGEPTVYPRLGKIIADARNKGFERIALCTNGRKLAKKDFLLALLDAGVSRITLSIHSHRATVEDRLCGRRGAFEQKIAAIRNIVTARRDADVLVHGFALNTCIHALNHQELEAFCETFKRLGVTDIRLNFLRPEHQAVSNRKLVCRLTDGVEYLTRLFLWNESAGRLRLTVSDFPWCVFPAALREHSFLLRKYLGEYWDLETAVVVYRQDGRQRDDFSWRQRRTDKLKSKPTVCRGCALFEMCEGVWTRYLEIYGAGELSPLDHVPPTFKNPEAI
jgi:MoaA/NifB/PqqE/SkfB family radical SAM enzyme